MSFSVNNNRLKCISVAQCRMSIVSNLNRSARTRKHSTLSEVYSCSHIQYCGSFFIRAYISILIQLSIGQPFYMNLMWLKSILCDINYSNSIFGWCFVSSLSLFPRCILAWIVLCNSIEIVRWSEATAIHTVKLSMGVTVWSKYKFLILSCGSGWQINYGIRINGYAMQQAIW